MQACPLFMMALGSSVGIVVARSASSRMMAADLPPSSSVQRLRRSPHSPPMRLPPTPEPVKLILSTPGCVTRCSDTSRPAGHHREHALGQPALLEDLGQPEGVERRLGRRLVDDRAAGGERRRQLGRGDEERHVPRRDRPDHADRLLGHEHLGVQQAVAHLVEGVRARQVGVVVEDHRRRQHLAQVGEGDRRAHLPRDDLGHVAHLRRDLRGGLAQDLAPLGRRHARPGPAVEGGPRRGDRLVDVGLGAVGHPGDDLLAHRRHDADGVGPLRGHPVAADEQAVVVPNRHASLPGVEGSGGLTPPPPDSPRGATRVAAPVRGRDRRALSPLRRGVRGGRRSRRRAPPSPWWRRSRTCRRSPASQSSVAAGPASARSATGSTTTCSPSSLAGARGPTGARPRPGRLRLRSPPRSG